MLLVADVYLLVAPRPPKELFILPFSPTASRHSSKPRNIIQIPHKGSGRRR
jgi:hypothetical protein